MNIPKYFRLTVSQGSPWIDSYLLKYSAKLPFKDALQVSQKLSRKIHTVNRAIEKTGIPPHLQLAYVNPKVSVGVFLKPDRPLIKAGSFIGIYTGLYELVDSEITTGTSYAYDVAQGLHLKKNELTHVSKYHLKTKGDKDYSIQTNALEMGNFTRYINHSSLSPNIEAVVSKFPDGRMEILLFALHTIRPGEQLLSCYGGQYWEALGVIPNDMKPDTYLLTSSKAKHSNPTPSLSAKEKDFLTPLRNVFTHTPPLLKKHPLMKALKKESFSITKNQEATTSSFEDFVLERGIPRKWQLSSSKEGIRVSLKKGEKTIRKNTLVGFMAGTFSLKDAPHSLLVAQGKKANLFLDGSKTGNFLSFLPKDLKKSNLRLRLVLDEDDTPLFLVFASKTIHPQDPLTLSDEPLFTFSI